MAKKVFHSLEEFREYFFPETVAKERRDRDIEERGFGVVVAEEIMAKIKREG